MQTCNCRIMAAVKPCAPLLLFLLICYTNLPAQSADSMCALRQLQKARTPVTDIKHIVIDLRFDWDKKQAYGSVAITFTPLAATNTITLDAGMLSIQAVILNDRPLTFVYDGGDRNDGLRINLDRKYKAAEVVTIKIKYHTNYVNEIDPNNLSGVNGKGLRFSRPGFNDPNKPMEVYSVGEFESNRYWFPCYDAPGDWRTTEFIATVDQKLTVVSNGDLLSRKINTDGTQTTHYKTTVPYANHLTSFIVGEYKDVLQKAGTIGLHNYGYLREVTETTASVERLPDMIHYFSRVTGLPYPYRNYSQVFVQDLPNWIGGNSVSTITENMVDDYATHADYFYLWDQTEAEALASQWFGSYTGCKDWSDIWLNRAFSRYFNFLYNEQKNGKDEFLSYLLAYDHSAYLFDWNNGYRHPVVTRNYDDPGVFTTDNYSYGRGAEVLHMLRKHLGEEKWWEAIRLYMNVNAGKPVTTKNFMEAVNKVSEKPMDWFFDQWVYKMGHPVFEVTKQYNEATRQLTLIVKQVQQPDSTSTYPQARYFKGKLAIEIDENIEQVVIEDKAINTFVFTASHSPRLVNFDYESTWIKEIRFPKEPDEWLYQLQHDKDILGRYAALNELSALAADEKTTASVKESIRNACLSVLKEKSWWRFRSAVLLRLGSMLPVSGNGARIVDSKTQQTVLHLVNNEKSWLKMTAIGFLGATRDTQFIPVYLDALTDKSDRVVNAAAVALAKTKSTKALPVLKKLAGRPSMKSQSLLSVLAALKELGDPAGFDIAYAALANAHLPRWRLPTGSVWDYRVFAATTIAGLKMGSRAHPLIWERLQKSLGENDVNGVFNNALLLSILADPAAQEAFDLLKEKYKTDANALQAVAQLEEQFKQNIKKTKE